MSIKEKLGICLIGAIGFFGLFAGINAQAAILQGFQGGTGFGPTVATTSAGLYLQVASTSPWVTYDYGNPTGATTTINGTTSSAFSLIGDGTTVTSTVNGTTTTFSVISGVYLTGASGTALFYPLSSNPAGYLATNTGNWAGTWQNATSGTYYLATNPSNFISSSTGNGLYLRIANNLSDVANSSTALSNLGGISTSTFNATGTQYYFPIWATISTLSATSSIFQASSTGNIGIGTTSPQYAIDLGVGLSYGLNGLPVIQASTTLFNYFLGGAGNLTATGTKNTGTGYQALSHLTTGSNNTANGDASLYSNTTGSSNTANGYYSLDNNTTGGGNTANGYASLYSNTTGGNNIANGDGSLYSNTTGGNNTANGYGSLYSNTTGGNNTANGYYSLYNNTTNIATLGAITGGSGYTPGTYTGVQMTLSSGSSATTYPIATIIASSTGAITSVVITTNGLGFKDTTTFLTAPTSSLGGTGSGFKVAVASLSTGQNNTADGYQAGRFISGGVGLNETSTYSTYIGYNAYPLASGDTNETVIGDNAVGLGSNTIVIGSSTVTATELQNGVVIGTSTTSTAALSVVGSTTLNGTTTLPLLLNTILGTDGSGNIIATTTAKVPSIATTTKTINDQSATTTDYEDFVLHIPGNATATEVSCYNDNAAGNTFTFNIAASTTITTGITPASSSLLFASNQTCTATSTASVLTSFANPNFTAGQTIWLIFTAASTTQAHVQLDY